MEDKLAQLGRHFWQFQIAGVTLPHLKVQGRVSRRECEWWLKVWGGRLLFCAASAPDKVFAVVSPCEDETDLVAFWRAGVQRGDFGEMPAIPHFMARPAGRATLVVFKANNGRSWARDWCGGNWIEFIGPKFPDGFPRDSLAASEDDAMIKLWNRPFPQAEPRNQIPFWLRGSFDEWASVLQACAVLYYDKNPRDSHGLHIEPGEHFYNFYAQTPSDQGFIDGIEDYDRWEIPDEWHSLFADNFVFVGWECQRVKGRFQNVRSSYKLENASVTAKIRLTLNPSQHEQLEARLFLRDWLRGKVPNHQIENLLE